MRIVSLCLLLGACGPETARLPGVTGLEELEVTDIQPRTWLPGTRVVVSGKSFVDATLGTPHVELDGTLDGVTFHADFAARYVDSEHLELDAKVDAPGAFQGTAIVTYDSLVDGQAHQAGLILGMTLAKELTPRLDRMTSEPQFVNDPAQVAGDGFLLGGNEGQTRAIVSGCFQPAAGGSCLPVGPVEIPAVPRQPFDRSQVVFPYATAVSGIRPGTFSGTVMLRNLLPGGVVRESASANVNWQIGAPMVAGASPGNASLGQFVFFHGGGFVGGEPDEVTLLRLDGTFTPEGQSSGMPISVTLIPAFQDGNTARYVLDEQDALGQLIDLRHGAGTLHATVTPTVRKGSDSLDGTPTTIDLQIRHVKQVVWVKFLDSYVDSLRLFGLRGVDGRIRERIFEVARRDYQGVNIEFRADEPQDFALYAVVEIAGPDPNDLDLLGYDNTPGKDVGNQRLFDQIGGINARTQEDGFPGYGGIFAEEFMGFSEHPAGVKQLPIHTPLFDRIFDPFRPDQGGLEVTAQDLFGGGPPKLADTAMCPAPDRPTQLGCAILVLGNLIGTTMTHEVGHSLGLANPYGDGYHDAGDLPNRLMDTGGARPFEERAEILGQGPAVFCDMEYDYLRNTILVGSPDPAPQVARPGCD